MTATGKETEALPVSARSVIRSLWFGNDQVRSETVHCGWDLGPFQGLSLRPVAEQLLLGTTLLASWRRGPVHAR